MRRFFSVLTLGVAALAATPGAATVIDFESGFTDNQVITSSTFSALGIMFSTINADEPDLELAVEARGPNDAAPDGFLRDESRVRDAVDPGLEARMGDFFMRTGFDVGDRDFAGERVFRIDYGFTPDAVISGEIWDIDGNTSQGTEAWRVEAFSATGALIGAIDSPVGTNTGPTSLDGDVWVFEFLDADVAGGLRNVAALEFSFVGTKRTGLGLAFDNFVTGVLDTPPSVVPVPASLPLLLVALIGVGAAARRRAA